MKFRAAKIVAHLPPFIWVLVWLPYYSLLIRNRPMPDILAGLSRCCAISGKRGNERAELDRIWRIVNFILKRVFRSSRPCLIRSLLLYRWCREHGLDGEVAIGVYKTATGLKGHAWLILEGLPFHEDKSSIAQYTLMLKG